MIPRAGIDGCRKPLPSPGFDPRTVKLVAGRYKDRSLPAYICVLTSIMLRPIGCPETSVPTNQRYITFQKRKYLSTTAQTRNHVQ
jgi:hypothetical protein